MRQLIIESRSEEATQALGEVLGRFLPAGAVLALDGQLGAGKTRFVQGLARGLGLPEGVTSPTFTLVSEHEDEAARLSLYHMDAYRLESGDEFAEAGLPQYYDMGGVTVIEWAGIVRDQLPERCLWLMFTRPEETVREYPDPAAAGAPEQIIIPPDEGVRRITLTVPAGFGDAEFTARLAEVLAGAGRPDLMWCESSAPDTKIEGNVKT